MFRSLLKTLPEISIFHHPSSPPSTRALNLLQNALSNPYPVDNAEGKPLEFNLQVVETPPTPDQFKTIMSYLPSKATNPSMVFLSAHPSGPTSLDQPTTVKGIAELAEKNPLAIKWPIVVGWTIGKVSIGDVEGVKGILEYLRQKRDGELEEGKIDPPKGWFS